MKKHFSLVLFLVFSSTVFGQSGFNPPRTTIAQPLQVQKIGIDTTTVSNIDTTNYLLKQLVDSTDKDLYILNDSIRVYFSQSDAVIDTTHTFRLDEILEAVSVNCEGINETNYINGKNTITFSAGTAVIQNYSFRSSIPTTTTTTVDNNYVAPNQNFTTTATSRINDNRATIIAEFQCTAAGTLIPRFRSEIAVLNGVTLKVGTILRIEKIM